MANIIIYITMFIIGTVLGSFFTLAVYRIPLKQDITHERSYCPYCKHKLSFLDLIPVFSYMFLKGKCRYCKQKIRTRYILLEIISGVVFLLFVISLKINVYNLDYQKLGILGFGIFYISTLIIIAGIEKEQHSINKSVMLVGLIFESIYIIYLYALNINIYRYVIYLLIVIILVLIDTTLLKKLKRNYTIEILLLCFYILMGTNEEITILSIIITLLLTAFTQIKNSKHKKKKFTTENILEIPIGYYLAFSNIAVLILQNFIYSIN